MTIEAKLDRLIELQEQLLECATGSGSGSAPAKEEKPSAAATKAKNAGAEAAKKAAAAAKAKKGPSLTDVKDAAKNFIEELGGTQAQGKEILKTLGAAKLDQLDEDKYQEAIDLFNAGPESSDDDNDDLL